MKSIRSLVVVLAFYCLGLAASSAQDIEAGSAQDIQAGPITRVTAVTGAACAPTCDAATTKSANFGGTAGFVDVPGASAQIKVERKSLLIARFASDSECSAKFSVNNMPTSGFCQLLVLASVGPGGDFVEMEPVTSGFAVVQMDGGVGTTAVERSSGPVSPGTYTVKVQFRISADPKTLTTDSEFRLLAWHLTAEAATITR